MVNLKPILAGLCASSLTYLCFLTWAQSKAASFAEGQGRTGWIAIADSHAHVLHSPAFWVFAIIAFAVGFFVFRDVRATRLTRLDGERLAS